MPGGKQIMRVHGPFVSDEEVRAVAEKIIHEISSPYQLEDGSEINTSVSIGISSRGIRNV